MNFRLEDISDDSHSFTNFEYYSTGTSRCYSYKKTIIDIWIDMSQCHHILYMNQRKRRNENILSFETKNIQEIN